MDDRYWLMIGTAAGTIIGTTIGGAVSIISSVLTHRGTLKREREAKRIEWERQRVEAERRNLRELQEALEETMHASIELTDYIWIKNSKDLPAGVSENLPPDVMKPFEERIKTKLGRAVYRAEVLRSWVANSDIRSSAHGMLMEASKLQGIKSIEEIEPRRLTFSRSSRKPSRRSAKPPAA